MFQRITIYIDMIFDTFHDVSFDLDFADLLAESSCEDFFALWRESCWA